MCTATGYSPFDISVTWEKVTDGSLKELFRYYSDCEYLNDKKEMVNAMTVKTFRAFYTNPYELVKVRLAQQEKK